MSKTLVILFFVLNFIFAPVRCKMFKPCELAKVLMDNDINVEDISTWMCIARYESTFNSSAVGHMSGDGSLDHGIFQINDRYWCTDADDDILACGITCRALEDDNLSDDIACARRIYKQHKRLAGNGWSAWAVYPHYCTSKEKNDQRFLINNKCSLNSLTGPLSSKLQLLPGGPVQQPFYSTQPSPYPSTASPGFPSNHFSPFTSTAKPSVFNPNKFSPFTSSVPPPTPGFSSNKYSPFTSTAQQNSVFNSNKFSPFTSSVPPPTPGFSSNKYSPFTSTSPQNSVFNSNKFSPFTSSFSPVTTSVYPTRPSSPVFFSNNHINSFPSSTVSPTSRFPTTSSGLNQFQFSSTVSTLRPSDPFFALNGKSQFSSFVPFPSIFRSI